MWQVLPFLMAGQPMVKAAAGGGATTAFNPADLAGITLSGGNLTAVYASTADAQVRSVAGHSTGKYYCEFTVNSVTGVGYPVLGVASALHTFANYCGQDLNSVGQQAKEAAIQNAYLNATPSASLIVAAADGDVWAMEVDLGVTIKWKDLTQASSWSNVLDISTMTNAPFYICINLKTAGDSVTLNTGGSAYLGTPESGYGNW